MNKQTWTVEKETITCEIENLGVFTKDLSLRVELKWAMLPEFKTPLIMMQGCGHSTYVALRGEGVEEVMGAIIRSNFQRDYEHAMSR